MNKSGSSRAERFADSVRLPEILTLDKVDFELYGVRDYGVNEKVLRRQYEAHERVLEWRDYPTVLRVVEARVETYLAKARGY